MGQVMARRFAREGAKVMVAGRNKDNLRNLADEIDGSSCGCDITNQADLRALVAATLDRFGKLDVAINATGYGLLKPFLETTRADLDYMTAVQFTGPFQFFQEVLKGMADSGSIIQISSATATIMLDNHAAYMGTKAGIDHVIRCIANEYGERGIRANSISPGLTDTPMTSEAFQTPAFVELFRKEYPLGRIGTVEDVAEAALWLASDACFMTGQNLQVNGGLTLRRNPRQKEIEALLSSSAT
ncbi:oxidoreductase [Steroidobacter denitrificans]|uniref:Oxidoreductase n=2 Tax=Steroidobacter denitrificans TaxID=465721 RepID=A0A127FBN6_STEDE|nr:oxidoreductase [Steroidobacter denitrificans]